MPALRPRLIATFAASPEPDARAFLVLLQPTGGDASLHMPTSALQKDGTPAEVVHSAVALVRRADSEFPFVAVGRSATNDVSLEHDTISKFHAYFTEADGRWTVQDARSQNHTFVDDVQVPGRGLGPPTGVTSGQRVRFGSLTARFLDPAAFRALVQARAALPPEMD